MTLASAISVLPDKLYTTSHYFLILQPRRSCRGRLICKSRQPLNIIRGKLLGEKGITDVNRILLALAVLMISSGKRRGAASLIV